MSVSSSLSLSLLALSSLLVLLLSSTLISAQTSSGYSGYSLSSSGDPSSTIYSTSSTPANTSVSVPPPDVYLHATVYVQEIDLTVDNLTAKVNLDAQVLSLLQFNAGVDASIDRVRLSISDVNAEVYLEARLENLVLMINDVLHSIDLQPILATLATDVNSVVNNTVGALTSSTGSGGGGMTSLAKGGGGSPLGSFVLSDNILYSINDYTGHTHTNRVLAQNGSIVDEFLDNDGQLYDEQVVGYYLTDMSPNGVNISTVWQGTAAQELQYVYTPFYGLEVVCAIFVAPAGGVVGTQVVSELSGGGMSTIEGGNV